MSNSFNISDAFDIAAAVVKIDAIKNDTGPIRNDVTAIHDTNLPAVKNDTGPIRNDVTAIHDTMLPAVKTDTGAIRNDVTDIHDTNLPAVKIDTGAIRNDVDDIKVIANSILADTAALPQKVRGKLYSVKYSGSDGTLQDVVNVTGQGKLYALLCNLANGADTVEIKLTIDSLVFNLFTYTGATTLQRVFNIAYVSAGNIPNLFSIDDTTGNVSLINLEFSISLLIQTRRSAGSGGDVHCYVNYILDDF